VPARDRVGVGITGVDFKVTVCPEAAYSFDCDMVTQRYATS